MTPTPEQIEKYCHFFENTVYDSGWKKSDLGDRIQDRLNSPEVQKKFREIEERELSDWAALRHQTVGYEDSRLL